MATSLSPPAEITAEWTVHAQLTIVRSQQNAPENRDSVLRRNGCSEQTSPSSFGADNSHDATTSETMTSTGNVGSDGPLRVVYKWSTDDLKAGCDSRNECSNLGGSEQIFTPFTSTCGDICCRSSISGCSQPLLHDDTSSTIGETGPKCRSTCSIVLTACTDLYPTHGDSKAPAQYNTTATCVVTPSPGEIFRDQPKITDPVAQFISVKDAFCQTSDGEFKAKSEPRTNSSQTQSHHNQRTRSQRAYDYRRATESMLFHSSSLLSPNVSFEEGTPNASLSRQPSHSPVLIRQVSTATSRTYSPGPNVRIHNNSSKVQQQHQRHQHVAGKPRSAVAPAPTALAKKSPRTVHIDVYCTGSEAEDSDNSSISHSSSGSTSPDAVHLASYPGYLLNDDDAASNSTPQTVFNANQIRLNHSRITNSRDLPRRLAPASNQTNSLPIQPGHLRQFILDQENAVADKNEINESKKMLFSKHIGDNGVETPISKFSFSRHPGNFQTVEPSEGGFSSNYPNSSRSTFRDPTCSSISSHGALASSSVIADDLEHYTHLSGGDSFENVGQDWSPLTPDYLSNTVDKGWRSPEKERKFLLRQRKMLNFVQQNQQQMREQTEDREESPPVRNTIFNNVSGTPRHHKVLFTPNYEAADENRSWLNAEKQTKPMVVAVDSSMCGDVSQQYRRIATPFGSRVEMTRKKHFGPAKNPDCLCDHCRRWLAERGAKQVMRERAASVGEEQRVAKRSSFWLMRQ